MDFSDPNRDNFYGPYGKYVAFKDCLWPSIAGSTQVPEAKLYHPLAPSQTRLVLTSLKQDNQHDLQLVVIDLAEGKETPPSYAAIPYTWGDPAEPVPHVYPFVPTKESHRLQLLRVGLCIGRGVEVRNEAGKCACSHRGIYSCLSRLCRRQHVRSNTLRCDLAG